ncbi:GPW/gp25 family protein [Serratia fonticola]|uniref:GPW/gp25 family protein n=1 Tax=Serratia fonticola TaxID=47917 RepID=UPI001377F5F2|nr:GPW/gp25 family protein [Serratia fonticola]NCG53724.1 baseplate assembly protein [Serratia fonticola]
MNGAKYIGMSSATGRAITDGDHINQSVNDILLTPIGSRVMRRNYGSLLDSLIDQPSNMALRLQIMTAIYSALTIWESRISLTSVTFSDEGAGKLIANIAGTRTDNGDIFNADITLRG